MTNNSVSSLRRLTISGGAGAEITVQECDTEIKQTYQYKGIAPLIMFVVAEALILTRLSPTPTSTDSTPSFTSLTGGRSCTGNFPPRMQLLWLLHSAESEPSSKFEPGHMFDELRCSGRVIPMSVS